MQIKNLAGLTPREVAELDALGATGPTLQHVVRWGFAQVPPLVVCEVIVQDEFTHDVVLPYRRGAYLVFDTT